MERSLQGSKQASKERWRYEKGWRGAFKEDKRQTSKERWRDEELAERGPQGKLEENKQARRDGEMGSGWRGVYKEDERQTNEKRWRDEGCVRREACKED